MVLWREINVPGFLIEPVHASTQSYDEFLITVDEHKKPLPTAGGDAYYNLTGGDRGMLNAGDIEYSWDNNSIYTAEVVNNPGSHTWGGMWYSLIKADRENIPLNFNGIFGPYIKSEHQGRIIEAEILVNAVDSPTNNDALKLKIQLNNASGGIVHSEIFTNLLQETYPKTYLIPLDPENLGEIEQIQWVMDQAQVGDSISIDSIRLKALAPSLPTEEQAFLWTYSWLIGNYDDTSGLVQDRSNFGIGDMENITATAKAAKITYYAYLKGFISYSDTVTIITKIADTLINIVPRGPSGVNTLWPHFTENGGSQIVPNTEWASGDTAYAALDIIVTLEMLGDPQNQLEDLVNFLTNINWVDLEIVDGENTYLSHGYTYTGNLIPSVWRGFGMETIGVIWPYTSVTGNRTAMDPPPSDNGSGFIDNANYPIVSSGSDHWGNDWDAYRNEMADTQIGWYCTPENYNQYYCDANLFGLSAAEHPEDETYDPVYGVGGRTTPPYDGDGVIVLHYSGMIADIRLASAIQVWEMLRDRIKPFLQDNIVISPLNNMESMHVDKDTGEMEIKHLKGSWNLALQAEGWAMADAIIKNKLQTAVQNNTFLNGGYKLLKNQPPTAPINPTPKRGAHKVALPVTLSWDASIDPDGGSVEYDIYIGKNANDVRNFRGGLVKNNTSNSYDWAVVNDECYYWRVMAKDEGELTTAGEVWSFCTEKTVGNASVGVFDNGYWMLSDTKGNLVRSIFEAAGPTDGTPVTGDWDGNGEDTVGIYKNGYWWLSDVGGNQVTPPFKGYGPEDGIPVTGDWDGDGINTVGVYKNGYWYLNNEEGGSEKRPFAIKVNGEILEGEPVTGDWGGNGVDEVGIYKEGYWYLSDLNGSLVTRPFGMKMRGDVLTGEPVVGDWDQDGTDTIGLFMSGRWYLGDESGTLIIPVFKSYDSTSPGAQPVTGNWEIGSYAIVSSLAETLTFSPSNDAFVRGGPKADRNYGSKQKIKIKGAKRAKKDRKTFIKFDLSEGELTSVESAKLKLYVKNIQKIYKKRNPSIGIYSVENDDWKQDAITWNNAPAIGELVSTWKVKNLDKWHWVTIDITELVNSELEKDGIVSLALEETGFCTELIKLASRETSHGPILEIVPSQ